MAYLDRLPVAVSGAGGHNATLRAACECIRFGLDDGQAWEALQWFNNYRCQPKWSEGDLRHKLADARKIVGASGQTAKHVGRSNFRAQARTFTPPAMTVRKIAAATPKAVPVVQRSEADEDAWWAGIAASLGMTLVEFDERCGAEAVG